MAGPTPAFWQERFDTATTPWDRGAPGPQLERWIAEGVIAPGQRVLVPGCGSGWDVAALAEAGMAVTGIDYVEGAVTRTRHRLADRSLEAEVVQADVLAWNPPQPVDAVYEQTCLCALHPDHWTAYAAQLATWVRPGGTLFALFMQRPDPSSADGAVTGPPYHCDIHAMRALFPSPLWHWPKPPYERVAHPSMAYELAVVLTRAAA
ncbi:methyltransferase domain-containing protein [Variovorax robiniae]|uniref:Methyltransferase domain-containing protein n=1 Tax=Variovorax robiniae TaxID=1836199 RepID=A0ABU8XFG1_9BURK